MSEVFTASNGHEVHRTELGTIWLKGERALLAGAAKSIREFFLHEAETDWQAKRDAELGRWRSPEHPDFVVYGDGVAPFDSVRVLDERAVLSFYWDRGTIEDGSWEDIISREAARAYFDAHPAPTPRPGEDAKPGDAWVLTVGALEPEPYTRSGSQFRNTTHWWDATNQAITAGYPLWVDGKAVNGQEAGA